MPRYAFFALLIPFFLTACVTAPAYSPVTPTPYATSTAESISVPEPTTAGVLGCTPDATFVRDVTIPDDTRIKVGTDFTKTWAIRNTGTCTWEDGYRLVRITSKNRDRMGLGYNPNLGQINYVTGQPDYGDAMALPDSVAVPRTAPGDIAEVSVEGRAPVRAGLSRSNWRLCMNEYECFGPVVFVRIRAYECNAEIQQEGRETVLLDSERQAEVVLFHKAVMTVLAPADENLQTWRKASADAETGRLSTTEYHNVLEGLYKAFDVLSAHLVQIRPPDGLDQAYAHAVSILLQRRDAMQQLAQCIESNDLSYCSRAEVSLKTADTALFHYLDEMLIAANEVRLPYLLTEMVVCAEAEHRCWVVEPK